MSKVDQAFKDRSAVPEADPELVALLAQKKAGAAKPPLLPAPPAAVEEKPAAKRGAKRQSLKPQKVEVLPSISIPHEIVDPAPSEVLQTNEPISLRAEPSREPEVSAPPSVPAEQVSGEAPPPASRASNAEVIAHAAIDSIFFSRTFFPKTFRQASPSFHRDLWALLDDPLARYVNIQVMRGGAKTTLLRTYMAKRVAYGISRTILYVGASESKATDSIGWVKNQIERNRLFADTFGLSKSRPWMGERAVIRHGLEGFNATLLALGITGSLRGINIDDHRPDLIIIDDVIKDDNAATPEQRLKIAELILGAVKESLAPASEVPDAKMVIINTPQDFEDLSQKALKDPQFRSARFGCWTPETEELPIEFQESAWPERWSSDTLRKEKRAAIARNMLSTFARENECRLVTTETSSFRQEWIRYFGEGESEPEPPRHEMWVELVVDPVPPPSDIQIAKGLAGKDFEALTAVGRWRNKYYVLETVYNRGHQPNWTVATFFELCNRWNPRKVLVESVAYQATLAWLLREAMKRTGRFWPIEEFKDKRKKINKITDGLSGPLSNGALYIRRSQATLISQIIHFPGKNPSGTHDDVIETVALGVTSLSKGSVGDVAENHYMFSEENIPALSDYRGAP